MPIPVSMRDYKISAISEAEPVSDRNIINLYFDALHDGMILPCNPRLEKEVVFRDKNNGLFKGELCQTQ